MGGYYMPQISVPQDERSNGRLIDLIMQGGEIAARRAAANGEIWSRQVQGLGQLAGNTIQQVQQQRQQGKRDAAITSVVSGWDGNSPDELLSNLTRIAGPADGVKLASAVLGYRGAVNRQGKEDLEDIATQRKLDTDQLQSIVGGYALAPDSVKPHAYSAMRPLVKRVMGLDLPEQSTPEVEALIAKASAPGGAFGPKVAFEEPGKVPVDPRSGQPVGAPVPGPAKPDTRSLDVQAADALARGDNAAYDRLLKIRRDMKEATVINVGGGEDTAPMLTPAGLDMSAEMFATTGQLPPMGMGKAGAKVRQQIINRAAELHPGTNIALNKASYGADTKSLSALQSQVNAVAAFERTAEANSKILEDTLKRVPDAGSRWINRPWREMASATGSEDVAAFNTIRQSVQNEYARIISNPALSGTMSDSARKEAEALLDPNATVGQIRASLKVLKMEAANRHKSYQEQIDTIKSGIGGSTQPAHVSPQKVSRFKVEVE